MGSSTASSGGGTGGTKIKVVVCLCFVAWILLQVSYRQPPATPNAKHLDPIARPTMEGERVQEPTGVPPQESQERPLQTEGPVPTESAVTIPTSDRKNNRGDAADVEETPSQETTKRYATMLGNFWKDRPIAVAPSATNLVIEVGTNIKPDFLSLAKRTKGAHFVGLEPIEYTKAVAWCAKKLQGRSTVLPFAIGPEEGEIVMNIGLVSKCSSLLPLVGTGLNCTKALRTRNVTVIRLDTLLRYLVPPKLDIFLLALDMQGYDLYGAASLSDQKQLDRVANFMIECQDLPTGDDKLISPGALTCGEADNCIARFWGFNLLGCWPNMNVREYNCIYMNPNHKLASHEIRPGFNALKKPESIIYQSSCPKYFVQEWNHR
jgi:hypothetical protein